LANRHSSFIGSAYVGVMRLQSEFTPKTIVCDTALFDPTWLKLVRKRRPRNLTSGLLPLFTDDSTYNLRAYRTFFGPYFHIPGLSLPGVGAAEHVTAMARMIEDRFPSTPGKAARYRSNQLYLARRFRGVLHAFKRHLVRSLDIEHPDDLYSVWRNDKASPKYKLRTRVHEQLLRDGVLPKSKECEYKVKRGEPLAPGKVRGIGSVTAETTQMTGYAVTSLKAAWAHTPFVAGSYTFSFVASATDENVLHAGEFLYSVPAGQVHYVYHSDDSSLAAQCSDGLLRMNVDIAKCDNSHTTPIFDILRNLITTDLDGHLHPFADSILSAFEVLKLPLRMHNAAHYREQVEYRFSSMRLYSGSTLTTLVNNLANLLIGLALRERVPDPTLVTKAEFCRSLVAAAASVGYAVTHEICEVFEDIQFLKHSYSCVDGGIVPWKNLGTWLRMFGTTCGDLPGSGDITARAKRFNSEVVLSRQGWGNHILRDAFNAHLLPPVSGRMINNAFREVVRVISIGRAEVRVPIESLQRRYRCSYDELIELAHYIRTSTIGDAVFLPIVNTIYQRDYG